jgi:hypothetical protein
MLVRTQISLPSDDHRRAKGRAAELGVSLSEYIRRLVARDLGEPPVTADVTRLFGLGDAGRGDVSSDVDAQVAAALQSRRPSRDA